MKWFFLALALLVVGIYLGVRKPREQLIIKTPPVLENSTQSSVPESPLAKPDLIPVAPSGTETIAAREEIEQKTDALHDASMRSDSESFQIIVKGLKDERKEVRDAAIEAAVQFGSRDAIPVLKELAEKTGDAREKVEILNAIEFLELPSLNELKPLRRTNAPTKP